MDHQLLGHLLAHEGGVGADGHHLVIGQGLGTFSGLDHRADSFAAARVICEGAPLAVQATKASSARYLRDGEDACIAALAGTQAELAATDDAEEGVAAFRERRKGNFAGK